MVTAKKNEYVLRLNEAIYSRSCIEQAMKDYSHLSWISITAHGIHFTARGTEPAELIAHEFGNYVLGLMKNS